MTVLTIEFNLGARAPLQLYRDCNGEHRDRKVREFYTKNAEISCYNPESIAYNGIP